MVIIGDAGELLIMTADASKLPIMTADDGECPRMTTMIPMKPMTHIKPTHTPYQINPTPPRPQRRSRHPINSLPTLFPRDPFYERTRSEYDERLGGSGVDQWVLRLPDAVPQHIWNTNDILQGRHVGKPNGGDGVERKRERRRTACF